MNGSVQVTPELSSLIDALKGAATAAVQSIPSLPPNTDLVTASFDGDLLGGEKAVIDLSAAGVAIVETLIAKLKAFAAAKA